MVTNDTSTNSTPLLNTLIRMQQTGKLNDYEFAAKMDVPRPYWTMTRNGKRPIGLSVIKAILRTYPELTDDVIAYLRDGDQAPLD